MQIKTIHDIDFGQLYLNHKALAGRAKSTASRWDQKSQTIEVGQLDTPYSRAFINAMHLAPTDTLLDVGCGVGTIAIMAAPHVKQVYALDYSQGMLNKLKANAAYYNAHNIHILCKDIDSSWHGIPQSDIVVASRSTLVENMEATLLKLHHQAKRHVYLSYPANNAFGSNPEIDVKLHPELGTPTYLYILNILHQHGITAQLRFISNTSTDLNGDHNKANWALIDWQV